MERERKRLVNNTHWWVFREPKLVVQPLFQFRVYKTLNKKKRHRERKSAEEEDEDTKKKHQTNKQNGEHTIRPVALVGGVGVRPRRF